MHRDSGFVLVDHPQPHVALVTLNRPERMNSMAFDVMVPLKEVLAELTYDNSVRVVVLTGAGRGFSSGADHKSAGSVPHVAGLTRPTYGLRSMELLDDVILAMRKLHQPVIAAVNGAAIGGGLCLALAAESDRSMSGRTRFVALTVATARATTCVAMTKCGACLQIKRMSLRIRACWRASLGMTCTLSRCDSFAIGSPLRARATPGLPKMISGSWCASAAGGEIGSVRSKG